MLKCIHLCWQTSHCVFLYTFPISNSILLTWVGWGGQGGGAIGIKIGAQVANQVATRGWQTCCRYLVSSLAMSSFLGHLDNFLDRSELLRKLFKVYRYSYTYFIEEEGNDDCSCNDDGDENDDDNNDGNDDNDEYYNDDDDHDRDVSTVC